MSTSTTLEVKFKNTGLSETVKGIKDIGTAADTSGKSLKTVSSTVDQVSKSTTSLGAKLQNAGSKFSGTITSVSTLGATVLNLSRQYQDLSDSQIRVDKTQLKVSRTAEASKKAHDALNKLLNAGVKSGKAYEQAMLDVKQADEASALAVTMHGEALEDQQRNFENFFIGLAPTVLAAGGSITSMFKEMGGEKGLGGLGEKLKGLSGKISGIGLGGLTAALGPLALAAAAAAVAIIAYNNATAKVAAAKAEFTIAKNTKTLADELDHLKKGYDALKLKPGTNPIDFLAVVGGAGVQNFLIDQAEKAKDAIIKEKTETEKLTAAKEKLNKALADPALKSHVTAVADTAKKTLELAQAEVKRLEAIEKTIPVSQKLSSSMTATNRAMGENTTLLEVMTKPFTGNSVFYTMAQNVDQLKASFVALNQEADRNQFMKLLSQGNLSAVTKKTPIPLFDQPALDPAEWFAGAFEAGSIGFNNFAEDSRKAAEKIKADQKAAAAETQAAWDKAFNSQVTGIDKIFAAYHKLHPGSTQDIMKKGKKIGERTFAPGQLPIDIANKAFEAFESGMAHLISSPASAKTYVTNWVTTAAAHMKGVAGQMLAPITEYINAHKTEAPETFMSGFLQFLNTFNLTGAFSKAFLPVVTVAKDTATQTTAALGGIAVPPAATKSVVALDTAINKILPQYKPKITVIAPLSPVTQMQKALANIRSKTVTVTVKAQLDRQLAGILPRALANAQANQRKQHGFSGTVKRPTSFLVGEGGRPEDVYIKPRGSAGQRPGGDGDVQVNVYLDGERIDQGMRYRINKFQGVMK